MNFIYFCLKVSRLTKVEFNCLKLVLSIDSWVAVLDFFGVNEVEQETSSLNAKEKGAFISKINKQGLLDYTIFLESLFLE